MTHETIHGMICPKTGRHVDRTWTNHDKPGAFNECPDCAPENDIPLSERLAALNAKRKA